MRVPPGDYTPVNSILFALDQLRLALDDVRAQVALRVGTGDILQNVEEAFAWLDQLEVWLGLKD